MNKKIKYNIIGEEGPITNYGDMSTDYRLYCANFYSVCNFICACNKVPLKLTKNGKFIDVPRTGIEHLPTCVRYKNNNKDSENDGYIVFDVGDYIEHDETPTSNSSKQRERNVVYSKQKMYDTLSYSIKPMLEGYNDHSGINRVLGNLYSKLSEMKFKSKNGRICHGVKNYCGLYTKYEDGSGDFYHLYFKLANGSEIKKMIPKFAFEKALSIFEDTYKTSLVSSKNTVVIVNSKEIDGKGYNIPYFIAVSPKGLVCDSLLEQRVYEQIENAVANYENLSFTKPYTSEVYTGKLANCLEDGLIRNDENDDKVIVVEVFGMSTEDYIKTKNQKIDFIKLNSNYYLLDIYPTDSNEELQLKIESAIVWLERQKEK